jgi:hypothetical protein
MSLEENNVKVWQLFDRWTRIEEYISLYSHVFSSQLTFDFISLIEKKNKNWAIRKQIHIFIWRICRTVRRSSSRWILCLKKNDFQRNIEKNCVLPDEESNQCEYQTDNNENGDDFRD